MPDQEVVIVGADGTEHVFPSGFDPKKAAGIVSGQSSKATPPMSFGEARTRPLSSAAHPIAEGEETPESSPLLGALSHAAHPQTTGDFLGLAIPSGIGEAVHAGGDLVRKYGGPAMRAGSELASSAGRGAVRAGAAIGDFVEAHPSIGAVTGGVVGYAKGGPVGAVEGALSGGAAVRGMKLLKTLQKVQAATGKVPPEPFEPVLTPGEPPAPGAFTPKQLNEARLAEIRAAYRAKQAPAAAPAPAPAVIPSAAAEPSSELAARMPNIRNTPSAGGALHYPGNEGMPQGPNLHDVAARTVGPDPAIQARYEWNPPPASAEQAAAAAEALKPVPLSKAVTAVRQAATVAKQKLTATEFTEATRLAKAGHPAESVLEAIQVQRALKGQSSFAGLPTDAEMRADMGNRARGGQKSLMGAYGDEPAVAGNPYR